MKWLFSYQQTFVHFSFFLLHSIIIPADNLKNYTKKEEKEVVELLKQSDQNAFNTLFRFYSAKLYHFSYNYLKSTEEAEEIVQNTFIKIWEKREAIDVSDSFSGFIFTVAHHLILNRIRKIRNENHCKAVLARNVIHIQNETEEKILYDELEKFQQEALIELPPRRKIIYQMIREEGMTYKQVAEQLNISVKTVESQMTEAIKHFRTKLSL
jgi:RNA polymerase sigma-70 factor (ECF subfamily)